MRDQAQKMSICLIPRVLDSYPLTTSETLETDPNIPRIRSCNVILAKSDLISDLISTTNGILHKYMQHLHRSSRIMTNLMSPVQHSRRTTTWRVVPIRGRRQTLI